MTLAAISPVLGEPTRIYGIKHTRKRETDRVRAMATEIRKLNQEVVEQEDSLEIKPNLNKLKAAASKKVIIDTYEDHRVAMSLPVQEVMICSVTVSHGCVLKTQCVL